MVGLFEEFYSAIYFDFLVEIERPGGSIMRYIEIMDNLTRHGIFMTETQLLTLLSRLR